MKELVLNPGTLSIMAKIFQEMTGLEVKRIQVTKSVQWISDEPIFLQSCVFFANDPIQATIGLIFSHEFKDYLEEQTAFTYSPTSIFQDFHHALFLLFQDLLQLKVHPYPLAIVKGKLIQQGTAISFHLEEGTIDVLLLGGFHFISGNPLIDSI
ncbi:hypothetical protein JK635_07680 [Neobacillus sp. YIM B02564]|uniref:Uncharacterized protein n=1 Tax=Neobacillus paridis TaxID=2803862 RepID=A0ABS1TL99_9BACI|nr:hypothetical protein [Neobacillus paridis]MBL4952089.1 hypothetical protein [Neobacillus paridis]